MTAVLSGRVSEFVLVVSAVWIHRGAVEWDVAAVFLSSGSIQLWRWTHLYDSGSNSVDVWTGVCVKGTQARSSAVD